jgi:hypothetical protein
VGYSPQNWWWIAGFCSSLRIYSFAADFLDLEWFEYKSVLKWTWYLTLDLHVSTCDSLLPLIEAMWPSKSQCAKIKQLSELSRIPN